MPPEPAHQVVRFGPYEANFAEGELRKHGTLLKIQAKPLAVLQVLVSKPGRIATREELRKALWQDNVFVDFEKNLATAVNKVRSVLNDSRKGPRYIETVPRRGYRFLAPVECGAAEGGVAESLQGSGVQIGSLNGVPINESP